MATDRGQALEIDREFAESDSSYGSDSSSELTSLSSSITAYVRLLPQNLDCLQRSVAHILDRPSKTAVVTTPTKQASTTSPTTKKKWTGKT